MQKNKFWEKTKEILKSKVGKRSLVLFGTFAMLHVLVAVFAIAGVVGIVKHDEKNKTVVLPQAKEPEDIFAKTVGAVIKKEEISENNDAENENNSYATEKVYEDESVEVKAVMAETKDKEEEKFLPDAGENNEILNGFSADKLKKSEITGDWRAHKGIDIKRQEMSEVYAFEDGKIEKIYDDPLMGKTVEIMHKDGFVCIYSNLDKNVPVNAGEEIKKGDLIGRVGKSSVLEKQDAPHLHFEIIKDGKHINPSEYMILR